MDLENNHWKIHTQAHGLAFHTFTEIHYCLQIYFQNYYEELEATLNDRRISENLQYFLIDLKYLSSRNLWDSELDRQFIKKVRNFLNCHFPVTMG